MTSEENDKALLACRQLSGSPEIQRAAVEQYEDLLRMADKCQRDGLISIGERNDLILEATRHYANAIEGLAGEVEQ